MKPARVFVCEAHPIVLEGLKRVLQATPDLEFVGCAESPDLAMPLLRDVQPDLLLLDQSAGLRSLVQFLGDLRRNALPVKTAMWVMDVGDLDRFRLMEAGVQGIVRKQASVHSLLECLRSVRDGNVWVDGVTSAPRSRVPFRRSDPKLTPRERDIVKLVAKGLTNREIARELSIAQGTVKVHLMHVFEKTGVRDRAELTLINQGAAGAPVEESSKETQPAGAGG